MPDPCKEIHAACAETFRQIVEYQVAAGQERSAAAQDRKHINKKLDDISEALLGNGNPTGSVITRLMKVETYLKLLGVAILGIPVVVGVVVALLQLLK